MPPDRHPGATEDIESLSSLRDSWPPTLPAETRGYRPLDLRGTRPLAAAEFGDRRSVVAVGRASGLVVALPCVPSGSGWRVAVAGDGVALAMLARLAAADAALPPTFALRRYEQRPLRAAAERQLGTDQSNISVAVGDQAIVKWRSAPDADGRRATRLRLHARANGFTRTPALLASLSWVDHSGRDWVLADVDAFLPEAEDGWDQAVAQLLTTMGSGGAADVAYAESLGRLTADLHTALARPSEFVAHPTRTATSAEMSTMRSSGLRLLERALAIEAEAQDEVKARAAHLRHVIEALPNDGTTLGPIHGDLHIGQLVAWRDGLDVIDFDGPPEPTAPPGEFDAPARDVAQMLCSLWNLAAVVDQRTEGAHAAGLQRWIRAAEQAFLRSYQGSLAGPAVEAFDPRLLEPLVAEQLCRELVYADAVLPRWRYAPVWALRWRYPREDRDD